jgi:hypothetical protein
MSGFGKAVRLLRGIKGHIKGQNQFIPTGRFILYRSGFLIPVARSSSCSCPPSALNGYTNQPQNLDTVFAALADLGSACSYVDYPLHSWPTISGVAIVPSGT